MDLNLPYANNGLEFYHDVDVSRFRTFLGTEQLVCDPMSCDEVMEYLKEMLQDPRFRRILPGDPVASVPRLRQIRYGIRRLYKSRDAPYGLRNRSEKDPFSALPFEVLLGVCQHLALREALLLLHASPWLYRNMRHSIEFWLAAMARHLPWFFEIREIIKCGDSCIHGVDLYAVILWAFEVSWGALRQSEPGEALRSLWERPHAILANRRRIWHVCEKLRRLYRREFPSNYVPAS